MNEKGFVASAVLYVMLGLFLSLMIGVIAIYANRKILMQKLSETVVKTLEEDSKSQGHGTREDYYEAARLYIKGNSNFDSFKKDGDVSFINVRNLISAGLLSEDIISPVTNQKETSQDNYVVSKLNGDDYTFSYVDNASAKDYIISFEDISDRLTVLEGMSGIDGSNFLDKVYPVGSIFITTEYTSKSQVHNALGGTWQAYGQGRTLVGMGNGYDVVGDTGGSKTKTISVNNLPAHTHGIPQLSGSTNEVGNHSHGPNDWWVVINNGFTSGGDKILTNSPTGAASSYIHASKGNQSYNTGGAGKHTHTVTVNSSTSGSTGSGAAFNVQDPFITVYMYKRTA